MDILTAITDEDSSSHVLAALPTGSGKTIPQLLISSLLQGLLKFNYRERNNYIFSKGSYCFIIPPLVTILDQLTTECVKYGLPFTNISKVQKSQKQMSGTFVCLLSNI